MKIGGLQRFTLIDYPGKVACTVFLSGCNFRCPWCYDPELVLPEKEEVLMKEEEFFEFLSERKGKLEGVVVCGGEPTVSVRIGEFLEKIKKEGFLVKLDTNGSNPDTLERVLSLTDYIAMDVKLPLERYKEVGFYESDNIKKSIDIVMRSAKDYEFRTTVVPGFHTKEDIYKIGQLIEGSKIHFLQNFLAQKTLDESLLSIRSFSEEEMKEFKKIMGEFVPCKIRNI